MLFVVLTGGAVAISPLSLAMVLSLPAVCVAARTTRQPGDPLAEKSRKPQPQAS
jgi:hypothetical protein